MKNRILSKNRGKFPKFVLSRKMPWIQTSEIFQNIEMIRLEKLTGNRAHQYSIRINSQWRVCFEWRDGDAWAVGIVAYH